MNGCVTKFLVTDAIHNHIYNAAKQNQNLNSAEW